MKKSKKIKSQKITMEKIELLKKGIERVIYNSEGLPGEQPTGLASMPIPWRVKRKRGKRLRKIKLH